jgi:lipopolysaccharide transport protein LptA
LNKRWQQVISVNATRAALAALLAVFPGNGFFEAAFADLVDEVEDLERQSRPDKQPAPVPSPADSRGEKDKPAGGESEPAPSTPGKPRKGVKGKSDRPPVQFESRSLQGMKDQGRVILKDDVIVTQGDFRIESDEATIIFENKSKEVTKVLASGRVKISRAAPEIKDRIKAECNEAVFHNVDRKVVLKGNARLWRAEDLVRGKQITYELDTGWIKADRVEGVVQPGKERTSPTRQGGAKK